MPDELVGGDTTEGAVPVDTGDAAGSTDNAPVTSPEAGTAPASAPYEIPEAYRDQYVPAERYQNLESKLGNWSQIEQQAQQFQALSQDPRVLAALQPQAQPAQPEQLPDFTGMQPAEVIKFMDDRNAAKTQELIQRGIQEFREQNLKPLEEATYTREANEQVSKMEAKYPDFKESAPAIADFIDKNGLADKLNENVLEMAYRYVTFEKQQAQGAKNAITKLQLKSKDTAVKPQGGSTPTAKAKYKTIAEAYAAAEDSATSGV